MTTRRSAGRVDVSELIASLEQLRGAPKREAARAAVSRGAQVVVEAAQAEAPIKKGGYARKRRRKPGKTRRRGRGTPGKLKKSVQHREFTDTPGREVELIFSKDPIAHLIEFGHDLVRGARKRNGGRVVGHVSAKPSPTLGFMRKAMAESGEKALKAMGDEIEKRLIKKG